jgi:predicted nuclease with TOPRIM domain
MRTLLRRLERLESEVETVDEPLSRMERYEQVQQAALSRLLPVDRSVWQEWATLWSERGDTVLTDAHRTVRSRWEETFYQVDAELPGPSKITAYDRWV